MADIDKIMKKIEDGRQYRRIHSIECRAAAEGEQNNYIVDGYACTFGEEYLLFDWGDYRVFESIDKDAFKNCDMSDVIMQYDHQGRVFARTSNKTLELSTDGHGLKMSADLGGTEIGRQLHEEIKGGYTNKMSFGFTVGKDERIVEEDHTNGIITVHRKITEFKKLYDVSAVSLPANDGTEISARSYLDGVIKELEAERLRAEARNKQMQRIRILASM